MRKIWLNGRPEKGNVVKLKMVYGTVVVGFYFGQGKKSKDYLLGMDNAMTSHRVDPDRVSEGEVLSKARFRR